MLMMGSEFSTFGRCQAGLREKRKLLLMPILTHRDPFKPPESVPFRCHQNFPPKKEELQRQTFKGAIFCDQFSSTKTAVKRQEMNLATPPEEAGRAGAPHPLWE